MHRQHPSGAVSTSQPRSSSLTQNKHSVRNLQPLMPRRVRCNILQPPRRVLTLASVQPQGYKLAVQGQPLYQLPVCAAHHLWWKVYLPKKSTAGSSIVPSKLCQQICQHPSAANHKLHVLCIFVKMDEGLCGLHAHQRLQPKADLHNILLQPAMVLLYDAFPKTQV